MKTGVPRFIKRKITTKRPKNKNKQIMVVVTMMIILIGMMATLMTMITMIMENTDRGDNVLSAMTMINK